MRSRRVFFKTHHGMMVKPKAFFGLSQEISFTVISWNRVKLYVPTEEPSEKTLTITGMLMEIVNCQQRGLVSQDSLY